MAESVALSKKTQKSFSSSVKNYKKLLKKGEIKITEKTASPQKNKSYKSTRGLVYLGNIPHGFYEKQMMEYFGQFGDVTRLRLARSKKSGKSKGFVFIEFKVPEVAKIVAETMDRYLMGKRLLKAQYIAPEEQTKNYFKGKAITENRYAKKANRIRNKKNVNTEISEAKEAAACKRMLKQVDKVQRQLQSVGIQYDFKPVDVPEYFKLDPAMEDSDEDDRSEMDSDDSDDIVFQPPVKTMSKRKTTPATATVPPKTKSFKKKKQAGNTQEKVKLPGITKKTKSKKSKPAEPIVTKKSKMIKNQILNSDQVNVKSAKDLKAKQKQANNKSPKGKKGKNAKKAKK